MRAISPHGLKYIYAVVGLLLGPTLGLLLALIVIYLLSPLIVPMLFTKVGAEVATKLVNVIVVIAFVASVLICIYWGYRYGAKQKSSEGIPKALLILILSALVFTGEVVFFIQYEKRAKIAEEKSAQDRLEKASSDKKVFADAVAKYKITVQLKVKRLGDEFFEVHLSSDKPIDKVFAVKIYVYDGLSAPPLWTQKIESVINEQGLVLQVPVSELVKKMSDELKGKDGGFTTTLTFQAEFIPEVARAPILGFSNLDEYKQQELLRQISLKAEAKARFGFVIKGPHVEFLKL